MDVIRQALESVPVSVSVGLIVLDFTIRIIALGVVPHNRRPSSAWGWLLAIYFIPLIGVFLYLLLGGSSLGKDRSNRQLETAHRLKLPHPEQVVAGKPARMPEWAREAVQLNHDCGGMPLVGGNDVGIHTDYDATLAAMEGEIRQAEAYDLRSAISQARLGVRCAGTGEWSHASHSCAAWPNQFQRRRASGHR